jgi:hypothetical protein
MKQEVEMTNMSLILKRNGFEKVAENKKHIVKFVQSMNGSEHVIFLWENEETKNQMISEFFNQQVKDGSSFNGLFSIEPVRIPGVENTLYKTFHNLHRTAFLNKAVEQVSERVSTNIGSSSTKYAFEDDTWLMKRRLKKQVLDTESALGREVDRRLSLLCMDFRPDLDEETVEKLVKAHGYVIIDQPLRLYKWQAHHKTSAIIKIASVDEKAIEQ